MRPRGCNFHMFMRCAVLFLMDPYLVFNSCLQKIYNFMQGLKLVFMFTTLKLQNSVLYRACMNLFFGYKVSLKSQRELWQTRKKEKEMVTLDKERNFQEFREVGNERKMDIQLLDASSYIRRESLLFHFVDPQRWYWNLCIFSIKLNSGRYFGGFLCSFIQADTLNTYLEIINVVPYKKKEDISKYFWSDYLVLAQTTDCEKHKTYFLKLFFPSCWSVSKTIQVYENFINCDDRKIYENSPNHFKF